MTYCNPPLLNHFAIIILVMHSPYGILQIKWCSWTCDKAGGVALYM